MENVSRLADALWRAITYVCVAQLHLDDNPLLGRPLTATDTKEKPSGHWGTVPGAALVLAHVSLVARPEPRFRELIPILGAGHAGVAQVALAWLTGDLAKVRPQFTTDMAGLRRLVRSFPDLDGLGSEVSPLLPGGLYLGGQLGAALAFAEGAALQAPRRVVVPLLGDGECETPTTAASWLASRELPDRGAVLPVIHLNGFRMGGAALLAAMGDDELRAYTAGMGWESHLVRVGTASLDEHRRLHRTLTGAIAQVGQGRRIVLFLRCLKGWSGPASVDGRAVLGTPHAHKTPVVEPRTNPAQLAVLQAWLEKYRPDDLFAADGTPTGALADALQAMHRSRERPRAAGAASRTLDRPLARRFDSFGEAVSGVLRHHARRGDVRLFSPDELRSNRLGTLVGESWAIEVLAEEVLLGWLTGWLATGRRGLLVSYEAFASLMTTGIIQHLKQRRMAAPSSTWPSLNLLLTSYGWQNTFTHGDPSLATALLATADPSVRVLTPADPNRVAVALDDAMCASGGVNVIIAGKHPTATYPVDTIEEEREQGLAIWPHASDNGEPDLVLIAAGDLPASAVCAAAPLIRERHGVRLRVISLYDLTALGEPEPWPAGLSESQIERYFGAKAPVLIATLGHPAAVWGLLGGRLRRPVGVVGWREPTAPTSQRQLASTLAFGAGGLMHAAGRLLVDSGVLL